MMVPTFLMTFPNGHILYLGSWHHERHPTMVYKDDNESTTPSANKPLENSTETGIDGQKCCSMKTEKISHRKHTTVFTYYEYVENSFVFENTQSNTFTIHT